MVRVAPHREVAAAMERVKGTTDFMSSGYDVARALAPAVPPLTAALVGFNQRQAPGRVGVCDTDVVDGRDWFIVPNC
jgi:hypothetical protein